MNKKLRHRTGALLALLAVLSVFQASATELASAYTVQAPQGQWVVASANG